MIVYTLGNEKSRQIFANNPIQLQFAQFKLEGAAWNGECKFDYVAVYDSNNDNEEKVSNMKKLLLTKLLYIIGAACSMLLIDQHAVGLQIPIYF